MRSRSFRDRVIDLAKRIVPKRTRGWVVEQQRAHRLQWPRAGTVDLGELRRVTPISRIFGFDRGTVIDRYYIEKFLGQHRGDIRGRCLELGDAYYITKFGDGKAQQIDVLHYTAGNPDATIVADLTDAPHIPSDAFDCIIFTQTLQMIFDFQAALDTLHRILKPGGVLLLTTHGISKIARRLGVDDWGEYWHFTAQSMAALGAARFPGAEIAVSTSGNVLAATAFLHGIAAEELSAEELDYVDPDFEVVITVRVQKAVR